MVISRIALCLAAGMLLAMLSASVGAQSSCIDCHTVRDHELEARGEPRSPHLEEFRNSLHYRKGVGCQDCHGGDPESFDKWRSHRGVLNSRHAMSPTNPLNLPPTCGRCHGPIFSAFSKHTHWDLLRDGDPRAPVCTTCHVSMASQLFVPAPRLCSACHGDEPEAMAPALRGRGNELLARMQDVGVLRRKAANRVRKIRDPSLEHEFEEAYSHAESFWQQAIEIGHGFRWDVWEKLIEESRESFQAILDQPKKRR